MPQLLVKMKSVQFPAFLLALIAVQIVCAVFFVIDAWIDFSSGALDWHLYLEATASLALIAAIIIEIRLVSGLLQRKAKLERSVQIARASMFDILEHHFNTWNLTPTERDIATFMVKGASIAEIAQLRGSAEGTIKAHLNAIYRKSGAKGRGGLLSLILDELLNTPEPPAVDKTVEDAA